MTGRIEGADFLKVIQVCRQNDKLLAQALRPSLDSPFAEKDESRRCELSEACPESSFRPLLGPNRNVASTMSLIRDRYVFAPNIDAQKTRHGEPTEIRPGDARGAINGSFSHM